MFSAEPGVWKLYAPSETSDDRCGGGHRKRNRYSHVRDEPGAQFWGYWGGGEYWVQELFGLRVLCGGCMYMQGSEFNRTRLVVG